MPVLAYRRKRSAIVLRAIRGNACNSGRVVGLRYNTRATFPTPCVNRGMTRLIARGACRRAKVLPSLAT